MATNKHIIDIKTKGAKKSEKQIKGVSGGLSGLAKQAGIAAVAYFGASGLINGIKSSTDAFAKQELAEKKLRFAAGASTQELIKQAQALQKNTRFGDEAIIAQQAYVKSLGISTKQTKEIIAASVDLAAAMNISLESAVMNTTKTLSGMQGELGEKLPAAFKELTAEQLKAGEGIVFIREQFKGTAEEEAQTLSGSLDQMSNAFGDLQETMGERLAPTISIVAQNFKNLIEIDPSQEAIKEQQEFTSLLRILTEVNSSTSSRELAIKKLKSEYIDYLGDLDIEKASLEDIEKLQTNQVEVMQKRIEQMVFAEQLQEVEEELVRSRMLLFENELSLREDGFDQYRKGTQLNIDMAEGTIESLEKERARILALIEVYKDKTKVVTEGSKKNIKGKKDEGKAVRELGDLEKSVVAKGAATALKSAFTEAKANLIAKIMKAVPFPFSIAAAAGAEALISAAFKKAKIQEFATGGLLGGNSHSQGGTIIEAEKGEFVMRKKSVDKYGSSLFSALNAGVFEEGGLIKETLAETISNTKGGLFAGLNIRNAVRKGREQGYYQLGGMVENGIDNNGANITLNISGNVLSEEFTEDVIIPQIKEGLRLGGDIGIN